MRTRKRENQGEKQIRRVANDLGKEEEEEMGEVEAKEREKTDTFDIRLGPEPQSRYEPPSLSADGQH